MRFPARTIGIAAVLLFLATPSSVYAAYTSIVNAPTATATMLGDGASDTLTITQSGGLFHHNRFGLDLGFESDTDFDSLQSGIQTIASTGTINIFANDGNDTIAFGDGVDVRGIVDGGNDNDTLDYSAYTTAVRANLGLGTTGLSAILGATQENPPTTHAGTATAAITNYNVTAGTFDIVVTVTGLAPAAVTGFHIHQGLTGVNGPIIVDFVPLGGLTPVGTGFTFTTTGLSLPAASEAAFLSGGTYVNIHTAAFPGGAIRGQLFSAGNAPALSVGTGTSILLNVENVTGGSGNDSLVGSAGINTINGGAGADWIVGGAGNDTLNGGAGADVLVWSNGDGTDVDEGGADGDTVVVNGNTTATDVFLVSANGTRLRFDRTNIGPFSLDIGTVETLIVNGAGGDDGFTVDNLTGVASLTAVNLYGFEGNDTVTFVPASAGAFTFNAHGGLGTDTLQGPNLATTWNVTGPNQGNITNLVSAFSFFEVLAGGTGTDVFNVKAFAAGTPPTVSGGAGADTINYDAESRAVSGDTTPPDGIIDSTGVQSVVFTQTETVNVINPKPIMVINDVTIAEGSSTTSAVFTVSLSNVSSLAISVNFATANGTGISPVDYIAQAGTLTFLPGEVVKTIAVPIPGDGLPEPTKTFVVNLSGVVNATVADAQGLGTITDSDVFAAMAINDVTIAEGSATTSAVFTVSLSNVSSLEVSVNFATANGTGISSVDYIAQAGTLTFLPGEVVKTITVPIPGDGLPEPTKTFVVNLSGVVNATVADAQGLGTITDSDVLAAVANDYDGDRKADIVVFRPGTGGWFTLTSTSGFIAGSPIRQFGQAGDLLTPGDYDRDGKIDLAVFRPTTGTWHIQLSSTPTEVSYLFGLGTDIPVPGDYDGDQKTDPAVYRPSNGSWYVLTSSSGYSAVLTMTLGATTDIPVPADYDGDGITDAAVYHPSTGVWSILTSRSGFAATVTAQWGLIGDIPVPGDYDGDGISDFAVFRPASGLWFLRQSTTGNTTFVSSQLGLYTDTPVPGDYDGDGKTDIAVWRQATGNWYLSLSTTGYSSASIYQFGLTDDIPVSNAAVTNAIVISRRTVANSMRTADLDGDGRADISVFRQTTGTWFTLRSKTDYKLFGTFQWGLPGDIPVSGDYDRDGVVDVAVFRPSTGTWFVRLSSTGFATFVSFQWGLPGDIPVLGDYDGDNVADVAVWRPSTGTWFARLSSTGYSSDVSYQWGLPGDVPVQGDYDGDGVTDLGVWRPSTGTWFIRQSSTGYATSVEFQWGLPGDISVPGDYDGDGRTDFAVFRPSTGTWFLVQSISEYAMSRVIPLGSNGDTPVPADYDGDGKTDLAVWRPGNGTWFLLKSGANFTVFASLQWGAAGDIPIPARQ